MIDILSTVGQKLKNMTRAIVDKVVTDFVQGESPGVLAISGGWGVGKTFALTKILSQFRGSNCLKRYAYTSVFGSQSLTEVRTALLTKTRKFPLEAVSSDYRKRVEQQFQRRNLAAALSSLKEALPFGGKHIVVALEAVAGTLISDSLVVLDDLERLTNKVTLEEIMGFVSELKEQARCKVILVFNEDQFDSESRDAYERYAEKVVDQTLDFNLTPHEAIDVGLPLDTPLRELLIQPLVALDVRNIRVIKKVEAAVRMFFPVVHASSHRVQQQLAVSIAVFACSLYERGRGFPEPSELVKYNRFTHRMLGTDVERQQAEAWVSKLEACGYSSTDDFDLAVLSSLEKGFTVGSDIVEQTAALDKVANSEELDRTFSDAWDLFHERLDVDAESVARALADAVRNSAAVISPLNLNSTVKLLRELGFDALADKAIEDYIERRRETPAVFDVAHQSKMGEIDDPKTRARFVEEFNASPIALSLEQAAKLIVDNEEWHDAIIDVFREATAEQLVALLKANQGPNLRKLVKGIFSLPAPEEDRETFRVTMVAALGTIAKESPVNRARVARFGVRLDDAGNLIV